MSHSMSIVQEDFGYKIWGFMILPNVDLISQQTYADTISEISKIALLFSERNWFLGTSGNISFKISSNGHMVIMVITASGIDKGEVSKNSFVTLDTRGVATHFGECATRHKPSHEYPIHQAIYEEKASANVIFHIHTLNAVLFADIAKSNSPILIENLEVLKGFGFRSYSSKTYLPILDNDDDPSNIASSIKKLPKESPYELPAVLIRNHGIFAWGDSVFSARRHVELLDHVFAILLNRNRRAYE